MFLFVGQIILIRFNIKIKINVFLTQNTEERTIIMS